MRLATRLAVAALGACSAAPQPVAKDCELIVRPRHMTRQELLDYIADQAGTAPAARAAMVRDSRFASPRGWTVERTADGQALRFVAPLDVLAGMADVLSRLDVLPEPWRPNSAPPPLPAPTDCELLVRPRYLSVDDLLHYLADEFCTSDRVRVALVRDGHFASHGGWRVERTPDGRALRFVAPLDMLVGYAEVFSRLDVPLEPFDDSRRGP